MGGSSWDTSRYLALFAGEATEHLEALGKDVVALEKGATTDLIDSMFRHAHSVKGMAASMSFEPTARLAHRLEDILEALRKNLNRVDASIADVLLQAVDTLLSHVRAASVGQPLPESRALVTRLADLISDVSGQAPLPSAPRASASTASAPTGSAPAPASAPPSGTDSSPKLARVPRYALKLKIRATSTQPGVRGFLAYKRLSTLGTVFGLAPPLEDIKAGRVPQGIITLELESEQSEEAIGRTMRTVGDVELDSLAPVQQALPEVPVQRDETKAPVQEPARTIRIRTELMDQFLDQASELLLATARVRELARKASETQRPLLDEAVDRLQLLVKGMHSRVMQARMTPIAVMTERLPRAARDIARRRSRDIELSMTGNDIELDRAIVDELADPVLHLLRNAIDHGIESADERRAAGKPAKGKVILAVRRVRDRVLLEVSDDGRGIDVSRLEKLVVERGLVTAEHLRGLQTREKLLLVCLPGFSTARDVTDISGRGVGMDAVKRGIEHIGGSLDIESQPGKGTTFRLSLPLTVAMVNLLLVGVGDEVYGLPLAKVSGVVETAREKLPMSQNAPVLQFGQTVVPVHDLSVLLEVSAHHPAHAAVPLVVVEGDEGKFALAVDRLVGQEEVVLKALVKPLDAVPGLAGVTILGSGHPVFILDVTRLVTA